MYKVAASRNYATLEKIFQSQELAFKYYYELIAEGFLANVYRIAPAPHGLHITLEEVFQNA